MSFSPKDFGLGRQRFGTVAKKVRGSPTTELSVALTVRSECLSFQRSRVVENRAVAATGFVVSP
jgi:hypothetical protein